MWESLISIATGKESCFKAIKGFFSNIDWDEIAMVSEADRAYFADGEFES